MATHSSILAQKLTWTEEPGGLHGVRRVIQELASKPPPPLYLKTNFFFFNFHLFSLYTKVYFILKFGIHFCMLLLSDNRFFSI